MGEIIDINRKRGGQQLGHDARPDEHEETELAKVFNGHWRKFLADCRSVHPDQMPRGVAFDVFKTEMDKKYGPGRPGMTDTEVDSFKRYEREADGEEYLFELSMLDSEMEMLFYNQLPATLLPYMGQQQRGNYDIPEEIQTALWHSRYERFLPELDNPFLLDQS